MKRRIEHLFVYGTLRPAMRHVLQDALRQHARWLGPGEVAGRLYDLGRYPGLVPNGRGGRVRGDLYRLRQHHVLLTALDRYEGCGPRMPRPREYRREAVRVHSGRLRLWAWVYVYNRPAAALRAVAGGDYLRVAWTCAGSKARGRPVG